MASSQGLTSWPVLERQNAVLDVPPTPTPERQAQANESWKSELRRYSARKTAFGTAAAASTDPQMSSFPGELWHMKNMVVLEPLQYLRKTTGERVNNGFLISRMEDKPVFNAEGTEFKHNPVKRFTFKLGIDELKAIVEMAPYLIREQEASNSPPDWLVDYARGAYRMDFENVPSTTIRMSPSSESSNSSNGVGGQSMPSKRAR